MFVGQFVVCIFLSHSVHTLGLNVHHWGWCVRTFSNIFSHFHNINSVSIVGWRLRLAICGETSSRRYDVRGVHFAFVRIATNGITKATQYVDSFLEPVSRGRSEVGSGAQLGWNDASFAIIFRRFRELHLCLLVWGIWDAHDRDSMAHLNGYFCVYVCLCVVCVNRAN